MTAFTQTLPLGAATPGGRAGSPGPATDRPLTGPCNYCPEQAEVYGRVLACSKRREQWCIRHFVAHARKHSNCRTCFREAVILNE